MSVCIDAMRHAYGRHVEAVYLVSGDGDYLKLIEELRRSGVQVWLGALSNGLSPKLRPAVAIEVAG